MADRNYKREYENYHGKPEQVANRSSRNKARRRLKKEGRVTDGDGKDVDHRNGNPKDNSKGNLRVRDRSANRADKSKSYAEAARLMEMVQRAGARHSSKDNSIIQQLHDLACELGAACPMKDDMMVHPTLRAKVMRMVKGG